MRHVALPWEPWGPRGGLDRIEDWHVITYRRLHLALPLRRRLPGGLEPYGGSAYWCLSSTLVHFVHGFLSENPDYVRFFEHVFVPDEIFFQTIIMNSELRNTVENDDLRYLDWSREPAPAVFTLERPARARRRSSALRAEVRRDRGRRDPRRARSSPGRMTTSSADRPVGMPAHADERAEAAGLGREQRERPVPARCARTRPLDVSRARHRVRAQHAARALQAGRVRGGLGRAPAPARRDHLLDRLRPPRRALVGRDAVSGLQLLGDDPVALRLARRRGRSAEPRREPRPHHEGLLRPARRAALRGVPRARRPRDRVRRARRDARRLRRDPELGGRPDAGVGRRRDARRRRGRLPALGVERALPRRSPCASARVAAVALREPGRVLELARRRRLEVRLRPEPDVDGARRVPLVDRRWPRTGAGVARLGGCGRRRPRRRPVVLRARRALLRGRGV